MASKAPFGTDIQPEFDIKLIGSRLVQVPTSLKHTDTGHISSNGTIYKLHTKETATDVAAVRAHRHMQDMMGRADGKRMSSVKTKRLRKLLPTINEEILGEKQQKDSEYLTFDQLLLSPRKKNKQALGGDRPGVTKAEGFNTRRKTQKSFTESKLTDLVLATKWQKQTTLLNILEPAVAPLLNRVRAVEDILQSCTRLDDKRVGVLETRYVARVFRSFGINVGETDLFKLAELTDSSLGSDHILYQKLCGCLISIFSGDPLNLDVAMKEKSTSTHTPCASIETYSPGSVEDYEMSINNITDMLNDNISPQEDSGKLPPLVVTSSQQHSRKPRPVAATNRSSQMLNTKSSSLHSHAQLPKLTNSQRVMNTFSPLYNPKTSVDMTNDMARLQCALESCADDKGMIDTAVALRVIKNYNLIYNLHLPIDDMRTQLRLKRFHNISVHQLMELMRIDY